MWARHCGTFLARRSWSRRVPFQIGRTGAHRVARHAEARIAGEIASLVWRRLAARTTGRAHAAVGRLRQRRARQRCTVHM